MKMLLNELCPRSLVKTPRMRPNSNGLYKSFSNFLTDQGSLPIWDLSFPPRQKLNDGPAPMPIQRNILGEYEVFSLHQ